MMMYQQSPRIQYVSQVSFVGGQFAISLYQIVYGFTPPPVQNQHCDLFYPLVGDLIGYAIN